MAPDISFGADTLRDLGQSLNREWLETNGLGGWASSTLAGAHTRRYHGLLVVATQPPVGRMVMLSKLEEGLHLPHEQVELGCNLFPGAVHPKGHTLLTRYEQDPFPTFTYAGAGFTLRKRVAMLDNEHTVVVQYELTRADSPAELTLRPFYAGRDYHHLMRSNGAVSQQADCADDILSYRPYQGQPTVHILAPGATFEPNSDWYYDYEYPREGERGLDAREDLYSCGLLRCLLKPGQPLAVVCSTADPRDRDGNGLLEAEAQRRRAVPLAPQLEASPTARLLAKAAGQFLVRRGDDHTILAGYHWFTDWGRDTMIALPGVCLVGGHFSEARGIFRAFANSASQGMIPNRFPDAGETPDYNTVDATLWFFAALHRYLRYTDDYDFGRQLWPTLKEIVEWHQKGTRYGIRVEADGLLTAGEEGVQLTWMDAKVDNWVVTPRQGKAVEINALWYNALRIAAALAARFGEEDLASELDRSADTVRAAFAETFWNESTGCLFDVVDGERRDPSIRPNQILALSLPFPLLEGERAHSLLDVVERHLFTPHGLRSLSPDDPAYAPYYGGRPIERDGAYHQGTVWGWLMGPYLTALTRLRGDQGRRRAQEVIDGFGPHLQDAGLGSVSEIFDGTPPHTPKGCIAQAWSVAELLRAYWEDVLQQGPQD